MVKNRRNRRPVSIPKYRRTSVLGNPHWVTKHTRWIRRRPRKVVLPAHQRAFIEGAKRDQFRRTVVHNMRVRLARPEEPARRVLDDLTAQHPLLIGFTAHIPKNFNQYGVTIGKYDPKTQRDITTTEIRNVKVIPILAVSQRELENPDRVKAIVRESEDILAEIDRRKQHEFFSDWQDDPRVQIFYNLDFKGERQHEIGLIDLEQSRPGEALTVSHKITLKQKLDRTGGLTGPDREKAIRFIENQAVLDYFAILDRYTKDHAAYRRATTSAERERYARILFGNKKTGMIEDTNEMALEPYLKTHYSEVLRVLQDRGLDVTGSEEHFVKEKGKHKFDEEGRIKGIKPELAFVYQKVGTLQPIEPKKVAKLQEKLFTENRKIAEKGELRQFRGEGQYYTESYSIEPVSRDMTPEDERDRKVTEKSSEPFREVIHQDLGKLRTIRHWLASTEADEKTRTKAWAVFVNDSIQRAIRNRPPAEAKQLKKLKTFNMNPMMMERSDIQFVEDQLGIVLPPKPKITEPVDVDYIEDQVVYQPEMVARARLIERRALEPIPEPTRIERELLPPEPTPVEPEEIIRGPPIRLPPVIEEEIPEAPPRPVTPEEIPTLEEALAIERPPQIPEEIERVRRPMIPREVEMFTPEELEFERKRRRRKR